MYLLLDLDNTILDDKATRNKCMPELFEFCKPFTQNEYEIFVDRWEKSIEVFYRKYLDGEITFQGQRHGRIAFSLNNNDLSVEKLDYISSAFDTINEDSWTIFSGWIEYFENSNCKKYIITNGPSLRQRKKIEKLGIEKYMTEVFVSEEIGFSKPDSNFFNHVLNRIDCKKDEIVVIGDSYENDIVPCVNLGIKCIWINHKNIDRDTNGIIEVGNIPNALRELANIEN